MGTEAIILPAFFAMIGFIVWTLVNGWQRRQQLQMMTDFNTRVLDKLGSVKDFNELIQTDAGAKLISGVTAERGAFGARYRILSAIQAGVVFLTVGGGFLILAARPFTGSLDYASDMRQAFTIFGVIALSLGAGLLLSSAASYIAARSLGILRGDRQDS